MAQRRYGPTRGAGTAIIEEEGQKSINLSALGYVGYAGILEKGDIGELIVAPNKATFKKKCGSIIADSLLPDCCEDFYNVANGAGGILLRRVTDGNEAIAEHTLYARYGDLLTPMGTLKAKNGGEWGGREKKYWNELALSTDLTETTLDTGDAAFITDQFKGGYIELVEVANTQYTIVGNDDAGVVTVESDATMLTDYGAGSDLHYYLVIDNDNKQVSYVVGDGEDLPDTEFSISVYVDDEFVNKYPNLSTNPTSARYWVNVINNDTSNDEIEAVDLWTGGHVAAVRPANHYGKTAAVTATILTADIHDFTINSPVGAGDPTIALGTTTDVHEFQTITITMSDPTTGTAVSDRFGALGAVTLATPFIPECKWSPPFTITAGAAPLVAADTLVINYKPFVADALIGGRIYPDKVNAKRTFFRIVDNDHSTITAATGSDLTADGAISDYFLVEAPTEMAGGLDGIADLSSADYNQQAWDTSTSVFNRVVNRGLGVIKLATPGINATAVQQAGVAYADAKNMQYRYEAASSVLTEVAAIDLVNDTLGRSDFAVMSFPSYGYVTDPDDTGEGKQKTVPLTGMIHGREARIAADYNGYHKAEAGEAAILPAILDIPTRETVLDEELLNPVGISLIKKVKGNFVIWGDRMLFVDPTWRWKHQREQMSYYEHVLQENFGWIIFSLNDPDTGDLALAALQGMFRPEWRPKRALRGDSFDDAAIIKIDSENNTDATRASGDMHAKISLQLADTVERFIITIGKQGIFESVAA